MRAQGPDGTLFEFPDGTPEPVVSRAIREYYAPAPQRGQRAPLAREVEGAMASFNRGLPFSTELTSAVGAVGAALQGQDPVAAYRQQTQRTQSASADFRARRPVAAALAEGTGMAAPLLATAGGAAPEVIAAQGPTRGLFGWANQTARAGATGAGYGYAYGAGGQDVADAPLQDRVQAGNEGAMFGAAGGAVMPTAINVARPAINSIIQGMRRLPTPAPNSLGANGGNLRVVSPPARGGPQIPSTAMNTIERLADRSGQNVDQLEQRFSRIQRNPQGEVLADAFDTPGVQTLRPIVQSPGRTGQRAATVARSRVHGAQARIMTQLNRALRMGDVGESRQAALARLEGSYRDLSADSYNPLWRERMGPEQVQIYEDVVAPLLDPANPNPELRSIMQRALKGARRQFNLDAANGRVTGAFEDNLARGLHYVKMELGALARFEASPLRGASGNRLAGLRELYRQFGDLLDPADGQRAIIPGYRNTTQQAGDYFSAREALDAGEAWLNMGREEVVAARAQMSPFELYHARVSLADAVRHTTRGRVVGNKNVANALDDPTIQDSIAAAFDNPQQAADFLETVNSQNQLARNALDWGGGSQTWANAMYGADEALHAVAESAGHVAQGKPGAAIVAAGRNAANSITDGMVERANNVRGEALLTRIDEGGDAQAFTRAIIAELRRRAAARTSNAQIARTGAAASGAVGSRRRK